MDNNYKLSHNFTLGEFLFSQTAIRRGIDNTPTEEHVENMKALCQNVLQPLRQELKRSIRVTSGYRSKELNTEIRGSLKSQHSKGEAADIVVGGWSSTQLCQKIIDMGIDFDQLIDEGNWVHVSYKADGVNRNEVLTANFYKDEDGKTRVNYQYGLKEV